MKVHIVTTCIERVSRILALFMGSCMSNLVAETPFPCNMPPTTSIYNMNTRRWNMAIGLLTDLLQLMLAMLGSRWA
jgi:hypothetical protein